MTRTTAPRAVTAGVAGVLTFALVLPAGGAVAAPPAPSVPTTTGTAETTHVPSAADQDPEPVAPESSEAEFVESDDAAADEVPAHEHEHDEQGQDDPEAENPSSSASPEQEDATVDSAAPSAAPSVDASAEPSTNSGEGATSRQEQDDVLLADAPVTGFGVVGVTWSGDLTDEHALVVHVRTTERPDPAADDPSWSDWEEVAVEPSPRGVYDGTEPVVVGDVAHVQARVSGDDVGAVRGLELAVINPGESSADDDIEIPAEEISPHGSAVGAGVPDRPSIVSRAAWGADESIMTWTPRQGDVRGAAIHHTAGTNDYAASDVPRIIRGIYAYHAQTRDWGDIGYNFLVDKYGRIWEGRAGGIRNETIGGHAIGFNSYSTGISMIGNYDVTRPTNTSVSAVVRLAAWKLALHGVSADGTVTIEGTRLSRVFGHRNVASTACPGRYLYERLGEIRRRAAALQDRFLDLPNGSFIINPNGRAALYENGRKHAAYCSMVRHYGSRCSDAREVTLDQWRGVSDAGRLRRTVRTTGGDRVYWIENGRKLQAFDLLSLRRTDRSSKSVVMPRSALGQLPWGDPVVRVGVIVVNRSTGARHLVVGPGKRAPVNVGLRKRTPLGDLPVGALDRASFIRMDRVRATTGVVRRTNGREFVLTTRNLVRTDGTGPLRPEAKTQHWGLWLMRAVPRSKKDQPPTVFVRTPRSSQRYFLRSGTLHPVSPQRARELNGGRDPMVHTILNITKRQFPVGSRL